MSDRLPAWFEYLEMAVVAFGAIGGVAGIVAIFKARADRDHTKAETENIRIEAAETVVQMLREQIKDMKSSLRELTRKVSILEAEVIHLGGDPSRLYRELLSDWKES